MPPKPPAPRPLPSPPKPRRPSPARDAALVLRRFPYGESSLVVHVLTRGHGRLSLLAKGAYRPRSGTCGVLDLFDTLELGWRRPARAEVGLLTSGALVVRRRGLTADLVRYRAGLGVLELAALGAREGEADPALFDLTVETLDALAAGVAAPALVEAAFDLRFLAAMGLAPALVHCAACGSDQEAPGRGGGRRSLVPFALGDGGRLCEACAEDARARGRPVETQPIGLLRIARSLLDTPAANLARLRLAPAVLAALRHWTARFLEYHLETRPRSRRQPPGARPAPTSR
ncbi:MAG: DNA repair protein RecO [Planctomycetota bacterium]